MPFPPSASWLRTAGRRWTSKSSGATTQLPAQRDLQRPHRDLRRKCQRTDADQWRRRHNGWRPQRRGVHQPRTVARRGLKASVQYLGTSKWRKAIPFTSQTEDAARTIVTVWTKSGNFSFLVADLENGPILAPEYGFFVRRTSASLAPASAPAESSAAAITATLLASQDGRRTGQLRSSRLGTSRFALVRGQSRRCCATVEGIAFPARGAGHASWQRLRRGRGMEVPVRW